DTAVGGSRPRLREHLRRHVDADDAARVADHLRRDERVGAGAAAEVEHTLTGSKPPDRERIGDPGERLRGRLGNVRELLRIAEVLSPGTAGREDEVALRLLRN